MKGESMKNETLKEVMGDVLESFKNAKYYYIAALVAGIYVEYQADRLTGWIVMFALCYYAATIGVQRMILGILKRINKASISINDTLADKLSEDNNLLSSLKRKINEGDQDAVLRTINIMINTNTSMINTIKIAKNGGSNE